MSDNTIYGVIISLAVVMFFLGGLAGSTSAMREFTECHEHFTTTDSSTVIRLVPKCQKWVIPKK